jgi:exodeoxyribonuclease VII small subunit
MPAPGAVSPIGVNAGARILAAGVPGAVCLAYPFRLLTTPCAFRGADAYNRGPFSSAPAPAAGAFPCPVPPSPARPQATKLPWPSWSNGWPRWRTASCRSTQLLQAYQRGAELLGYCRAQLQAVEQQVKVLEDGTLKTWEDAQA